MQDLKPQRAVESDSSWHFVGAQCDRADPLNHGLNSPVLFPRAVCSRHFSAGQNKAECATYRLTAASWIDWGRITAIDEAGSWDNLRERFEVIVDVGRVPQPRHQHHGQLGTDVSPENGGGEPEGEFGQIVRD